MTDSIAQFRVTNTMNIVGIGYIIAGEIISGEINPDYYVYFNNKPLFLIDSVEAIIYNSNQHNETALIIKPMTDDTAVNLLSLTAGQIIDIIPV